MQHIKFCKGIEANSIAMERRPLLNGTHLFSFFFFSFSKTISCRNVGMKKKKKDFNLILNSYNHVVSFIYVIYVILTIFNI